MARVLEANGAKVVREYYFNDHGEQIITGTFTPLVRIEGFFRNYPFLSSYID